MNQTNPNPFILVRLQSNENSWIIEIEDNGGGLLPEMSEESMMESSKPDGTGLGLFIVRTAMESHNGNLSLLNGSNGRTSCPTHPSQKPLKPFYPVLGIVQRLHFQENNIM